jgi:hypothetical protein
MRALLLLGPPLVIIAASLMGIKRLYPAHRSLPSVTRRDVIGTLGISFAFLVVLVVALVAGTPFADASFLIVGIAVPLLWLNL